MYCVLLYASCVGKKDNGRLRMCTAKLAAVVGGVQSFPRSERHHLINSINPANFPASRECASLTLRNAAQKFFIAKQVQSPRMADSTLTLLHRCN